MLQADQLQVMLRIKTSGAINCLRSNLRLGDTSHVFQSLEVSFRVGADRYVMTIFKSHAPCASDSYGKSYYFAHLSQIEK
jgi:hypothetical protein